MDSVKVMCGKALINYSYYSSALLGVSGRKQGRLEIIYIHITVHHNRFLIK